MRATLRSDRRQSCETALQGLCPNSALRKNAPATTNPSLDFILLYQGIKWWAHQGSNLGPDD
jgi:hypothetical protein